MIDTYEEENRRDIYNRSIRHGMIKEAFDKLLVSVARPVSKALKPIMQKVHPEIDFLDPIVESGLELATLHAVAEIVQASGSVAHKIPGLDIEAEDAIEATDAIARAMRGYSGDRIGNSVGEMSVKFLPLVKNFISNANMAGVFKDKVKSQIPKTTKTVSLVDLIDEEGNEK